MTKNREIAEIIFNEIRKLGYKPYDIEYGDSYFIFNGYEDSIIHFRLKGLGLLGKHWKFGMWINSEYLDEKYREKEKEFKYDEYYNVAQIFTQYDTQIDKFKPSVSSLCIKYKAYDWEKHINYLNPWHEIKSMLGMIKNHPFVSYHDNNSYSDYYDNSLILEFIKEESKDKIKKANEKFQTFFWLNYTKIKLFFAKKCKCINDIILYDFEKENEGWTTSYKYKILTTFKENISDEEMEKWVNFWFKKDKYGKYEYYSYVIELGSFGQIGNDEKFYFNYD